MLLDYADTIRAYRTEFEAQRPTACAKILDLGQNMYIALIQQYDYYEAVPELKLKKQIYLCKFVCSIVLPKLLSALKQSKDLRLQSELLALYEKFLALAARRDLASFLLHMGNRNNSDLWAKTVPIIEGLIYYCEKMFHEKKITRILVSEPPSCGKSYFLNNYSAWRFGQDLHDSNLRLSYSDGLVTSASKNVKEIVKSQAFAEVYPKFADIKFSTDKEAQWKIEGANVPSSYNAVTRDGAITGLRAYIAILDDMTKGVEEAMSIDVHERMWNKWWNEVSNRRMAGQPIQAIIAGTMWSLNDIINRLRDGIDFVPTKYKYTDISEDGRVVSIAIPALDENDQSVFSHVYSTSELHEIRKNNTEYFFQAVYQQRCIAADGLEFTYESLQTYKELPDGEICGVYGSLDSARKGRNYVSLAIVKKINDKHYLVDVMYRKKGMNELYDLIVDKIIQNNVQNLVVENNIDGSLKKVLSDMLKERGYMGCTIIERYSTQNKETRIKNNQGYIRELIVFPDKSLFNEASDMGIFMKHLTTYSFSFPAKFDDSIDSVSLLVSQYIANTQAMPKAVVCRNLLRV